MITIASICAILLPTYYIYLYRSPGIEFLKILIQHLNQCGIYFFLVTWMQVPVLVLVWLEAITFIKLCGFHSLMKRCKCIVHEDTIQRTQRIYTVDDPLSVGITKGSTLLFTLREILRINSHLS